MAAAALMQGLPSGTLHLGSDALLLTILGVAAMVVFSMSALRRRGAVIRYSVRVWAGGRKIDLDAMLDTGNMLHEPLSGLPVMLVDKAVGAKLMSGRSVEIPFGTAAGASLVKAVPAERVEVYRGG
jgi:hypothetical protein